MRIKVLLLTYNEDVYLVSKGVIIVYRAISRCVE